MEYGNMNISYDTEIDLLDLFAYLLRRWKSTIAAMLVFAVLLAGFKLVSSDAPAAGTDQNTEYELALQDYQTEKANFELTLEAMQAGIDSQKSYINNSALFKLNPANCPQASAVIMVQPEDGQADIAAATDAIVTAYNNALLTIDLGAVEAQLSLAAGDARDLVELVYKPGENALTVTTFYTDLDSANLLLDAVLSAVETLNSEFTTNGVTEHIIVVANRSENIGRATFIYNTQNTVVNMLTKQESNLTTAKKVHDALAAPAAPISGVPTGSVVKFAVIGAFIGVFLMAAYHCAVYIFAGRVRTDSDIQNLSQSPVLGIYPNNDTANKGMQKLASMVEGRKYHADEAFTTAGAAAYIRALDADLNKLLILGLCDDAKAKHVIQQLSRLTPDRSLTLCENNSDGVSEIDQIENNDAVIIIAERNTSHRRDVQQKAELARMIGKPIVGCVLV